MPGQFNNVMQGLKSIDYRHRYRSDAAAIDALVKQMARIEESFTYIRDHVKYNDEEPEVVHYLASTYPGWPAVILHSASPTYGCCLVSETADAQDFRLVIYEHTGPVLTDAPISLPYTYRRLRANEGTLVGDPKMEAYIALAHRGTPDDNRDYYFRRYRVGGPQAQIEQLETVKGDNWLTVPCFGWTDPASGHAMMTSTMNRSRCSPFVLDITAGTFQRTETGLHHICHPLRYDAESDTLLLMHNPMTQDAVRHPPITLYRIEHPATALLSPAACLVEANALAQIDMYSTFYYYYDTAGSALGLGHLFSWDDSLKLTVYKHLLNDSYSIHSSAVELPTAAPFKFAFMTSSGSICYQDPDTFEYHTWSPGQAPRDTDDPLELLQ